MTAAMVLAAGLGTRLRPLTDETPKPLVPIGDRPALMHVIERVEKACAPVVVNAHHFGTDVEAALAKMAPSVRVSFETDLLGTAGGVANAAPLLGEGDVLVWNADVLAELDARALLDAHARGRADATLAVREVGGAGTGNVGLDDGGRVVRLRKESFASGETRGANFLGIHVIGAPLRRALPAIGCLVGDVYIPCGHEGAKLEAFVTDASFVDVGALASYLEANFAWLRAHGETRWLRGTVGEGVELGDDVVIGEGASVVGEGPLTRVVVWPGATAYAPLSNAIVTPRAVVPLR